MDGKPTEFVPKAHPATREMLPEDPLEMQAFEVPGDPELMLRFIVEEYAGIGWDADAIMGWPAIRFTRHCTDCGCTFGEGGMRERLGDILRAAVFDPHDDYRAGDRRRRQYKSATCQRTLRNSAMPAVYNWQLGRAMSYPHEERHPAWQFAFVFNPNRCIGCQTCTMACKSTWTFSKGQELMWWNNVETKPYGGYPQHWDANCWTMLERPIPASKRGMPRGRARKNALRQFRGHDDLRSRRKNSRPGRAAGAPRLSADRRRVAAPQHP